VRLGLAGAGTAGLAALFVWAVTGLPDFGSFAGAYSALLVESMPDERRVPSVVAAVVYDVRALDTLAEQLILFCSAIAVALLLRDVREAEAERHPDEVESDALRAAGIGVVGAVALVGLYVVAHGYVSPGGGFQGGVVLAGAVALLFLAGSFRGYARAAPIAIVDAVEGAAAAGYAALGTAALAAGAAFLENVLPLGEEGSLLGGGTIAVLNWLVAVEVAAAFVLLFTEFLEELMVERT
jgi:multicomponent Na+:H+ antiporter subunit B